MQTKCVKIMANIGKTFEFPMKCASKFGLQCKQCMEIISTENINRLNGMISYNCYMI